MLLVSLPEPIDNFEILNSIMLLLHLIKKKQKKKQSPRILLILTP